MNAFKTAFWVILLAAVAVGCVPARKITYLLDQDYNAPQQAYPAPELTIQSGDILRITVSCEEASLAAPFNITAAVEGTTEVGARSGYTVNPDGYISFPVLGAVKVDNKTTRQIQDDIASRIRDLGYIKDPLVGVSLANFSVTVMGDIGNGVITVDGPSLNIFQAIARSGGTRNTSKIKDVMVMRTENGKRTAYTVNLQKKEVFDSPVFYLRQNDLVYVKPTGTTLSPQGSLIMTFVGTGLSVASIITNFLLWSSR